MKKSIKTCLLLTVVGLLTIETPTTVFAYSNSTNISNSEVVTSKTTSSTTNLDASKANLSDSSI